MSNKRVLLQGDDGDGDGDEDKFYRLKIFLPNGSNVTLALTNPNLEMSMKSFVNLVEDVYEKKSWKNCEGSGMKRKLIDWDLAAEFYLEFNGEKVQGVVRFEMFKPDLCNIIRLDVDNDGCVDLSGTLNITAGNGKSGAILLSDNEEIFRKESLIEKRELKLIIKPPESCPAGSNLANLIFKVTDSDGSMDTSIHHDEKSKSYHTMTIESDSRKVESGIHYAFVHGSCKVPFLSLLENEGSFSFKVFHSRYPELHMSLKIKLTPVQIYEREETECSTPYTRVISTPQSKITTAPRVARTPQTPCSQFKVLNILESPSVLSSQTGLMDITQYTENLKEKLDRYVDRKVEMDERLKCLEAEQVQAEHELSNWQASLESLSGAFPECLSTKESMMKHIKEKHHNTAASVLCCLYRKSPQSLFLSKNGVSGLVALLGSVVSTSISRVLSEYLGEETMLALVCNSSRKGPNTVEYLRLKFEAYRLGRSVTHRFHVFCLEATKPWMDGVVENDPQRKLAMDDPKLPNGDPIPGFRGYAVNMINLESEEPNIKADSGHGLRETLFYSLFGTLQVYETQKHVEAALPHINGSGAVSLDGFIAKENGYLYSECSKPEIHFPITVREDEEEKLRRLEAARDRVTMMGKKIVEEKCSLHKLEKKMKKTKEKYCNARHFPTL